MFQALVLALGIGLSCTYATTFYERPFEDRVQESEIIVRGKTGASDGRVVTLKDGSRRIYTYTEFRIEEVLKGQARPKTVFVREIGGQKDGVGMQVSGTATFTPGEDVVLTLGPVEPPEADVFEIRGMMMGKYLVEKDEAGNEVLAGAGLPGSLRPELRQRGGFDGHGDDSEKSDPSKTRRWTLAQLRALIAEQGSKTQGREDTGVSGHPNGSSPPVTAPSSPDLAKASPLQSLTAEGVAQGNGLPWVRILAGALILAALALWISGKRR